MFLQNADMNASEPTPTPPYSMLESQDDLQGENPIGIMQLHDEDLLRELRSSSRAQVAPMLPVCTKYDHRDRYSA